MPQCIMYRQKNIKMSSLSEEKHTNQEGENGDISKSMTGALGYPHFLSKAEVIRKKYIIFEKQVRNSTILYIIISII